MNWKILLLAYSVAEKDGSLNDSETKIFSDMLGMNVCD